MMHGKHKTSSKGKSRRAAFPALKESAANEISLAKSQIAQLIAVFTGG
jgi:hypothetical protein